jgi:hypothetical protein
MATYYLATSIDFMSCILYVACVIASHTSKLTLTSLFWTTCTLTLTRCCYCAVYTAVYNTAAATAAADAAVTIAYNYYYISSHVMGIHVVIVQCYDAMDSSL